MNITKRRALGLSSALLLAATFASTASAEQYDRTYRIANRAEVRVHANESRVHVITSDTDQVEFHVVAQGFRIALAVGRGDVHVDSQQSGDRVDLTVRMSHPMMMVGIDSRRLDTEVRMPKNADLIIDTHDGAVELSAVNGNITVHTNDGAIKASQLSGQILLDTKDGGIDADTLQGEGRLRSGDGGIAGNHLDGKFDVSSKEGSVRVTGRFDVLNVKCGDGSVTARVASGSRMAGPWSIRTKDGALDVALPTDFQANLDASANDGDISMGLPVAVKGDISESRVEGTLNGGGPLLLLRTDDGAIHLKGV